MCIFDGLGGLFDDWLGVDNNWPGERPPRYDNRATFIRLCDEGWLNLDGRELIEHLDQRIFENWSGDRCRGIENWRFEKQLALAEAPAGLEVPLERTISRVTDLNWVNQVPTAGGIDDCGAHALDLVYRCGSHYSFIELKVLANHALSAAFQLLCNGLVFAFSRNNSQRLGYSLDEREILRAEGVSLRVLAPALFYEPWCHEWLEHFENAVNAGLQAYSNEVLGVPMDFGFEAFPAAFDWTQLVGNLNADEVRREVLWAANNRRTVFGNNPGVGLVPVLV